MVKWLEPTLVDVLGDDVGFEDLFDELEVLMSLAAAGAGTSGGWAGRFGWRSGRGGKSVLDRVAGEIQSRGPAHPLLKAGFFGGNETNAANAIKAVAERANQM